MLRELPSLSLNLYNDTPVNHPPSELDTWWLRAWPGGWAKSDLSWVPFLIWCRRDISLVSNPPIGMSFGPWNISQSLPVKGATTNAFLFGFTEILLSKSAPNLDALIPLTR